MVKNNSLTLPYEINKGTFEINVVRADENDIS